MAAIAQLANIASHAKDVLGVVEAVADRGYYSGEEILACDKAGIAVTLPKPMTSGLAPKIGISPPQGCFYTAKTQRRHRISHWTS
jgi:hypothetical protein